MGEKRHETAAAKSVSGISDGLLEQLQEIFLSANNGDGILDAFLLLACRHPLGGLTELAELLDHFLARLRP